LFSLISDPVGHGIADVFILAGFIAATQQQYNGVASAATND